VRPAARNRVLTALTLAIVLLATAAFARTQALKQEEAPVTGIDFDRTLEPGCDCPRETAKLSFILRRAQPVTASVVDEDEQPVRSLVDGELRASGRITLRWDGRDDQAAVVPEGDYRLRLDLAAPDRSIVIPDEVHLRGEDG
jgi:flagellar hook capping protein FlgD